MGYTHVVFRSHLYGDEDVRSARERDAGQKSALGTYMTDGIVGASELRILASVTVVTVRSDQSCEKEGYCCEGSHGVAGLRRWRGRSCLDN